MRAPTPHAPQRFDDEALDILRRLEPVLARQGADIAGMKSDIAEMKTDIAEMKKDIVRQGADIARLDGRVSAMPTTWQLLVGVFGIMAAVSAFLRFGMPSVR